QRPRSILSRRAANRDHHPRGGLMTKRDASDILQQEGADALRARVDQEIRAKYEHGGKANGRTTWANGKAESTPAPEFDPSEQYIVPPFPFEVLPGIVQAFVSEQSYIIGCDPSAMAMAVLATMSGALHHGFTFKPMQHSRWGVRPRLWVVLCGDPSRKK